MSQANGAQANQRQRWLLAGIALVCVVASWVAWTQVSQRDVFADAARWDERDYWMQPIERNAPLRLPSIETDLLGVTALADGRLVAVGDNGTVLLSDDQGGRWTAAKTNTSAAQR